MNPNSHEQTPPRSDGNAPEGVTPAMEGLKTFQARTMAEALALVKRELGSQAVILHTRTVTKPGVFGCGGRTLAEITAAKGNFSLPAPRGRGTVPAQPQRTRGEQGAAKMPSTVQYRTGSDKSVSLSNQVDTLRAAVAELVNDARNARTPSLPARFRDTYHRLIEAQVAEHTATELVERIRAEFNDDDQPDEIRRQLAKYVEALLPATDPLDPGAAERPLVIAIVGPTGVGKTTTIAKLAANYRLRQKLDVGLITIDTERIAAVDQLRTYAKIIDVPMEVVADPARMAAAVASLSRCQVILIDTAGRSPNDPAGMEELKSLLDAAKPDEVHLALSATCSTQVLNRTVERFTGLGVNRLIFTKLDEAVGFGVILNCLKQAHASLSYVTTGQKVPDDIEVCRPSWLADLIVSGNAVA